MISANVRGDLSVTLFALSSGEQALDRLPLLTRELLMPQGKFKTLKAG